MRENIYKSQADYSLDIIICVHNALSDVRTCLNSVVSNTNVKYNLIIVNDGSDEETTLFLESFAKTKSNITLLHNKIAAGYTKAANLGFKASKAEYVIILNSDTITPPQWAQNMLDCAVSSREIGIVGPLSNSATWQSVPERFEAKGGWAVNQLPEGMTLDEFAGIIGDLSLRSYPQVEILNGFCLMIKRKVFDKIGYFDEVNFPRGYGEENDFCFRAFDAGFKLAVDDATYVYHAKSKSFGPTVRSELAKKGAVALENKHGRKRIESAVERLKNDPALKEIRKKVSQYISRRKIQNINLGKDKFTVIFLLPIAGTAGGIHSIVQEASGMRELNVNALIATWSEYRQNYLAAYEGINDIKNLFYFFDSYDELHAYCKNANVVVATIHSSILLLKEIVQRNPNILPAYYIQDYEPLFFEKDSEDWKLAYDSYSMIKGCLLFAKTDWIRHTVQDMHNVQVHKVSPSLDHSVYYPVFNNKFSDEKVSIAAMIRPSTPRRGADITMRVLKRIKLEFGEKVEINIFGTQNENLGNYNLDLDFDFNNYEILRRNEVSKLLRSSDIFLDFSLYQAFGRTGIEAMASGSALVSTNRGGIYEYAVDNENCLLVDVKSEDACFDAVSSLIKDSVLLRKIRHNGILKASEYSIRRAALSELMLFKHEYEIWMMKNSFSENTEQNAPDAITKNENGPQKKISYNLASIIIAVTGQYEFTEELLMSIERNMNPADEVVVVYPEENESLANKIICNFKENSKIRSIKSINGSDKLSLFNKGIEAAVNPYVILVSPYLIFPDGWLSRILGYFQDKRVGVVVPLIDDKNSPQYSEMSGEHNSLAKVEQINSKIKSANSGVGKRLRYFDYHCIAIRKTTIKRVGGFDENLVEFSSRFDFSWRIQREGYLIKSATDLFVGVFNKNEKPLPDEASGNLLFKKLECHYGKGNIPSPESIWGINPFPNIVEHFNTISNLTDSSENNKDSQIIVSIIMVTYNQLDYTKECLKSIQKFTDINYELIVIDNNSSDNTGEYLKKLSGDDERIRLILNSRNTGFPAAVNQGFNIMRGNYAVVINNDTVVTANWLDKLIEVAESNNDIGIVGPVSNVVSGVQLDINAKYKTIRDMHNYAGENARLNKGNTFAFPRVAFLCTLIKKEVLDKIGGLDERFTPGNYEDDDFCLRAQIAGYKTIIAKEVFIHHYGSKSFKADGRQGYEKRLEINRSKFVDKWGVSPEDLWLSNKKVESHQFIFPINKDLFVQYFQRARIYLADKEYSYALESLMEAQEYFKASEQSKSFITEAELYNLAGNVALINDDLENARTFFEKELSENPNSSSACLGLGQVFYAAEQLEAAKTMFEWSVRNDASNENALKSLAEVNEQLGLEINHMTAVE